ncbi:hypothetical protein K8R03_02705 [Candidatus Kaiserbacteria bacterium]|nr:hypothetical protein [Candidatus Kaiserbacteria bacterium]
MSDMQFNDSADEFGRPPVQSMGSDITGKLVSWGLAQDRKQAEYILMAVGALALLLALYFLFFKGGSSAPPLLPQ